MAANELPALTGSDKQIAWANDIRGKVMARLQEDIDEPYGDEEVDADTIRAIELAATHTEAKWWIDQRMVAWNVLIYAAADERKAASHE